MHAAWHGCSCRLRGLPHLHSFAQPPQFVLPVACRPPSCDIPLFRFSPPARLPSQPQPPCSTHDIRCNLICLPSPCPAQQACAARRAPSIPIPSLLRRPLYGPSPPTLCPPFGPIAPPALVQPWPSAQPTSQGGTPFCWQRHCTPPISFWHLPRPLICISSIASIHQSTSCASTGDPCNCSHSKLFQGSICISERRQHARIARHALLAAEAVQDGAVERAYIVGSFFS